MKRFGFVRAAAIAVLIATLGVASTQTGGRFDKPLTQDQRILHALNRLTFGPRTGDIEEVRRLGLDKWIALQLHPEGIPENPVLDARLKPLETLTMDSAAILKDYSPVRMMATGPRLVDLLQQDQMRRVLTGTIEEREEVLRTLDADKRKQVLAFVPPQSLASSPELQKEAEAARNARTAEMMMEARSRNPPLGDLLNPDQVNMAVRGNSEQLTELFAYLSPAKRQQVAWALPPQALASFPELRRQGMHARQPQQLVLEDLKEAKIFRALYSNRQLEEVLVDFWFNHFNVYESKAQVRPLLTSYERDAIRPHVLGHFKDLLLATAQHPAMLYYLDNWESATPGPVDEPVGTVLVRARRRGLNENYGREVMELHTLGVKGGYTQEDVIAVARCFTGWTIGQQDGADYVFSGFMHDTAEKTVLGHTISADGEKRRAGSHRYSGPSSFNREVHFARIGATLRGRRSAAIAGGPHG